MVMRNTTESKSKNQNNQNFVFSISKVLHIDTMVRRQLARTHYTHRI